MTVDDVCEALGGRERVQALTGVSRNALGNWRHDGIPFRHWATLIEAARERGILAIDFDALRSTRPERNAA